MRARRRAGSGGCVMRTPARMVSEKAMRAESAPGRLYEGCCS